jgi:hypothetical protein
MKTLRQLLLVFAMAAIALPCHAVSDSHRAAIERLFKVLKTPEQYEAALLAGFESGAGLTADKLASMPEEQQQKFKRAMDKVRAKMVELLGWEKMKPEMILLYAKHFSEDEIGQIIKVLDSPAGQMLVNKQIKLLPESMALGQKNAQAAMPHVMKIMMEEMQ